MEENKEITVETTFIYGLCDPMDGTVRYIGKAHNPKTRFTIHISPNSLNSKTYKNNWIKSLLKDGIKPTIEIIDEVSRNEWAEWEIFYIALFRELFGNLTNLADGGEGGSLGLKGELNPMYGKKGSKNPFYGKTHTPESKLKISEANKNRIISEETKQKMSERVIGSKNPMYGKHHSLETKQKLQEKSVGRKQPGNIGMKGKKHSESSKQKISETKINKRNEKISLYKEVIMNNSITTAKKILNFSKEQYYYYARIIENQFDIKIIGTKIRNEGKFKALKIIDSFTGDEFKFKSYKDAAAFLNVKRNVISSAKAKNSKIRRRFIVVADILS